MFASRVLCAGFVLAGFSGAAHATVLFDSLTNTTDAGQYYVADFPTGNGPLGASFMTGGTSVSDINVQIAIGLSAPASGGSFLVFIASDSGGSPVLTPLDLIATVSDSSLPGPIDTWSSGNIALSTALNADTTYWLVLQQTVSGTNAVWSGAAGGDYSDNSLYPGVDGQQYYFDGAPGPNSDGPYRMIIADTTGGIPEPATLSLLGMGLIGLALVRRRLIG